MVRLAGDIEFYRAAEVQDGSRRSDSAGRGALHHHVVVATRSQLDVELVQSLALAAGYGCVLDLQAVEVGADLSDLAAYISKRLAGYVSKSSGAGRLEVPWRADVTDEATGEVVRLHTVPTYRTHSQSAGWGCTVKAVRAANRDQARRRAAALRSLDSCATEAPPVSVKCATEPSPSPD